MSRFTQNVTMLNGVTANTTSDASDVSMRHKLSVELLLASVTGSGTIGFSVSNDGANFVTYNRVNSNVTDNNTQPDTRVATITLNSGTPKAIALFPEGDYFRYLKVIWTTVTGGIITSNLSGGGSGGSGYSVNDVLTIADGTGGTVTVLTVDGSGVVLTYSLTTAGTGYTIATHTSTGGGGTGFVLNVLTVNAGTLTATLQDID